MASRNFELPSKLFIATLSVTASSSDVDNSISVDPKKNKKVRASTREKLRGNDLCDYCLEVMLPLPNFSFLATFVFEVLPVQ